MKIIKAVFLKQDLLAVPIPIATSMKIIIKESHYEIIHPDSFATVKYMTIKKMAFIYLKKLLQKLKNAKYLIIKQKTNVIQELSLPAKQTQL